MAVSSFYLSDSRQGEHRAVAQINITPLVDVLLVLLVIFMVAAPALTGRLDMRLPQQTTINRGKPPPPVELRVGSDGGYRLDGTVLTRDQLTPALQELARQNPHAVLKVASDAEADYQGFAWALAEAQRSGLRDIAWE
ncbi:biopolymer transporter ExbD [Lysobacter sp. S4-A87]|uniref:ExbD/TolR family protein n=1 Tax=Lysobacter sp. S4-A87 TaxID=2925843 RepID=UPI001F531BD5|nr:biopolymer transporter ExbD [Lysobacter sp. S4-A87]UNK48262.1 biopolymer transporter ExbD [Lysobacter sp. S4-A87]